MPYIGRVTLIPTLFFLAARTLTVSWKRTGIEKLSAITQVACDDAQVRQYDANEQVQAKCEEKNQKKAIPYFHHFSWLFAEDQ